MKKKLALSLALLGLVQQAVAEPQWAWEAGKQTNNGAITIKSASGGTTYSGVQNPTGAVAKTNQSAVTQPPTVIIQATSGAMPFNYKDDCYVIDLVGQVNKWFIGAGKIDATASPAKFTGIMGWYGGGSGYGAGGQQVMTALLGAGSGGNSAYNPYWCGADASCAWYNGGGYNNSNGNVVGAAALPINSYKKCYP